jgi:gas vesicle protein
MIRLFLIGMLCGVIITAAVALGLTIPANSDHWRMEIWKRGGGAWTSDKNGHLRWIWTVKPVSNVSRQKPVIVPSSQTNVRSDQL